MRQRFVITATDTGVGKTVFSAALVQALGASYWKPVQAGLEDGTDSEAVAKFLPGTDHRVGSSPGRSLTMRGMVNPMMGTARSAVEGFAPSHPLHRLRRPPSPYRGGIIFPEAYRLKTPASPHLAAELDGIAIYPDALEPPVCDTPLVIEGAGGALVPLTRSVLFADVFARWQIPLIVCARTGLGTINHTLMTIEALRARNVPIHGIAFIGDAMPDSEAIIPELSGIRRLGRLPRLDPLTSETLAAAFAQHFDLADFA